MRMPDAVRVRLHDDLDLAARAVKGQRADDAWALLEEAHILSQPWALAHVRVHWRMLTLAVRSRLERGRWSGDPTGRRWSWIARRQVPGREHRARRSRPHRSDAAAARPRPPA